MSKARPKIADYPFTTLVPNLGVVAYKDGKSFVVADIPGLIEGASEGHGLGHQFLRHVERCRVLVHLVDLGAVGRGAPARSKDFDAINRELERYSPQLAEKPQIVVANKLDLHPRPRGVAGLRQGDEATRGLEVLPLSGATGEGLGAVLDACALVLYSATAPKPRRARATAAKRTSRAEGPASEARPRRRGARRRR